MCGIFGRVILRLINNVGLHSAISRKIAPSIFNHHIQDNQLSISRSFSTQSFTLTAATPRLLVPANPARHVLMLEVTGTSPATFKFGSTPSGATDGIAFDGASSSGGQGGSLLLTGDDCPIDVIYATSTVGTTVTVLEGTTYAAV